MEITMKKMLLAGAAVLAFGSSTQAADLGVARGPAAAIVAPAFNWTGFYFGGFIGGASRQARFTDIDGYNAVGSWNANRTSFLGGVTLGYNWQFTPNVLVGIEGELGYLGGARRADPASPGLDTEGRIADSLYGLITARAGLTTDRALFYVKGGLALGGGSASVVDACVIGACGGGTYSASSSSNVGWTIGGGIEYAIAGSWTMKGEYNYIRFNNRTMTDGAFRFGVSNNDAHLFKVGVNYLFSSGGGRY
jgi:outer membrane immunogenic protein